MEIARAQSEHLSELVAKRCQFAKLDPEWVGILPEPVVLTALLQDVVQAFELAAQKKERHPRRRGAAAGQAPLTGDIGLIERALRNLIKDALRNTPAGGEVRVALASGTDHTTVRVTDTGPGIDAADLPRIFDRFYRGEKAAATRPAARASD